MGLAGLLIAAIFAAAMSSMDTSLNSSATLYLCDIHRRCFGGGKDPKSSIRVLHIATCVMGIAGIIALVALFPPDEPSTSKPRQSLPIKKVLPIILKDKASLGALAHSRYDRRVAIS